MHWSAGGGAPVWGGAILERWERILAVEWAPRSARELGGELRAMEGLYCCTEGDFRLGWGPGRFRLGTGCEEAPG